MRKSLPRCMRAGKPWKENEESNMLITIALLVLCSSIVVFFSQEFIGLFKKIFSIPGVKLLFPLILASWLIEVYEDWGYWLLLKCQALLHQFVYQLTTLLPFETAAISVTRIIFLFLFASLPIWFFHLRAKQTKRRHPQPSILWLSLTLWIVAATLLSVTV